MTLFWRSFLLIALLIILAVGASFQIYRVYEREPRARELAQQSVSVVNLTRAALVNADPFLRRELLIELNEREGLRVYPVTNDEKLESLDDDPLLQKVATQVRAILGESTRFASERNEEDGFWVSFWIDDDEFWVMLPSERFEPAFGVEWLGWGLALLALALVGAFFIASRIARPLRALTRAAMRLGHGRAHEPLPEEGPQELRTVASAFNRMAHGLDSMERERAMVLAGISHDLRTPLSRLRLALEMSGAERAAADAMETDVKEMDQVIGQFLDFARGNEEGKAEQDLTGVLDELAEHYTRLGKPVTFEHGALPPFRFARVSVHRAIANLVDNALRYAGPPVEVWACKDGDKIVIEVRDRGPGIPADQTDRLKRPFTRLDEARSGPSGAGLGLAIVERVARAHQGTLELLPREGSGLTTRLVLLV